MASLWSGARMAWAQVWSRLGQLAVAVVVIALGVALAAGMLLANAALRASFAESLDALAGSADLEVYARSGGAFDEGAVEQVRKVEGVEAAAALLIGKAFLDDEKRTPIRIVGVDMLDDATIRVYERSPAAAANIADPLVFLNQPDSALVSQGFLSRHGLRREEDFEVLAPVGQRRLVARGILADTGVARAFGGELAVLDLFAAQDLLALPRGVTQIDMRVAPGVTTDLVAKRLREALPAHLGVRTVSEKQELLASTVAEFQLMLNAIGLMGLVLAVLITATRLATVYQERTWELGVLRAQGMSPGVLTRNLLLEATVLSLVAVAAGLPLGIVFAQLIIEPVADTMSLSMHEIISAPWALPRMLPLSLAAAAGVVAGAIAAWVPARQVVSRSIVAVLSQARRREPWPEKAWKQRARVVVPIAAGLLVLFQLLTGLGLASGLGMALLAVAGGLLIEPSLRTVSGPLGRAFGGAARIGVEDQSRVPSGAIGAAAVLFGGIAAVVWFASMRESFEAHVVGTLKRSYHADLVVDAVANENLDGSNEARFSDEVLDELARLDGIDVAAAELETTIGEPEAGLLAIDPMRFLEPRFGYWMPGDSRQPDVLERVARGEGVLADEAFLDTHRIRVGDVIRLATPTGPLERVLLGVADARFVSSRGNLTMSRELYEKYWHDGAVTRIFVVLVGDARVDQVRARILSQLGERFGIRVGSESDLFEAISAGVREGFGFLDTVLVLTLIVVLVGTADALGANVLERTREIGVMRACGLPPRRVAGMILAQALAIGLVGAGLAVVVGLGMSFLFVKGLVPVILGWQLESYVTEGVALGAAALGIAGCLIGALVPAVRAARLQVVTALRYE